ncbi:low temperature requirement protein A [Amycolatopsis sp. PS_44_ISF1]|uniref:low temperature requirement protein A n=1 Tax=Amycolatopsis sp. PS_44_ISF1 TaxID=2974917 RepID=UPI0028DF47DB|nr:low temperature requirement protein A [Amycolatopsis sp. PS_44_ISF1]MDT8914167.1 low temperature requirement protein A [Amycolatopsis sp. PS_44_ISF1]
MSEKPEEPAEERHASWLELFFDLVAVAGVGQLSHLVHGSTSWADVGLYVVCFLAFWTAWMCFTVYGNVAGGAARTMPVLLAMAGLVVMAASVTGVHGDHAKVFALAYIAVRVLSDRVWENRREGPRVLVDWPVAQLGFGVTPWVASLWTPEPWRYWLWALGVLIDLLVTFTLSGDRLALNLEAKMSSRRAPAVPATAAHLDTAHFGERLGLFTIIVLGEGVLTVTDAMAETPDWNGPLLWTAFAALAVLATLWSAALREGNGGIPYLAADRLKPRVLLPLHCLVAGLLAAFASGLGDAVEAVGHEHLEPSTRWLLAGCVAALAVIGALCGLRSGRHAWWAVVVLAPGLALPAVIAFSGGGLAPARVLWLLVLAAGAGLSGWFFDRRKHRHHRNRRTDEAERVLRLD